MLGIVLVEPEIPQNTGNIGRTCVAAGARLHLIEPLGFSINDKMVKRAGLDYWDKLDVTVYDDFNDLVNAIYRMTGVDSNESGLYDEVKMRLLGLCYDIRHAYMGDREVVLKDNALNEDLKEEMGIKNCNQNIYYSVNVLYPEALFLALAVPNMFICCKYYYGKRDERDQEFKVFSSNSDYLKDKALLTLLSAIIFQSLEEVIGSDTFNKVYKLIENSREYYMHYVTQYVDYCNLEFLKTDNDKRKDKLIDITKKFIKPSKEYQKMEKKIKEYAQKYQIPIYEVEDDNLKYPNEIEW